MALPFKCCKIIEPIVDRNFTLYNQEEKFVFSKKDINKNIFLQNFQNNRERIYKLGGGKETKKAEEVYDFLLERDHYCIHSIDQIGTIQNGTIQNGSTQNGPIPNGIQDETIQSVTIQIETIQSVTIQIGTIQSENIQNVPFQNDKMEHETSSSYNSIGGIFVPPYFFSVCPRVMEPENMSKFEKLVKTFKESADDEEKTSLYEQLCSLVARKERKKLENFDTNIHKIFDGLTRALNGDISERKVFDALKTYFNNCKEDALIIYSHKFNVNNQENDFIIVNLTKGYIMIIDVKYVLHKASIEKGVKQVKKASYIIKQQIGKELSSWTFIGLVVGMQYHNEIKVIFDVI